MTRARIAKLITESPKAHGVFDAPTEEQRTVYCTVRSIGQAEIYQANAVGLRPEMKLILAHAFEYHGEKQLIFSGDRYDIIRTYVNDGDQIELTVQKAAGNAAEYTPPEPETPTQTGTEPGTEPGTGTEVADGV